MDKEYHYLPGDHDAVSNPIELKGGKAALLYIQGSRPSQLDALWAGVHDGKLVICSSDGVHFPIGGGEMAKYVVKYGSEYAQEQLKETGTVDVREMQHHIRESINKHYSSHPGRATGLCMLIDDLTVQAHRVGDPDTRLNGDFFPHPALVPETKGAEEFRTWWYHEGRDLKGPDGHREVLARLSEERRRIFSLIENSKRSAVDARTLTGLHSGRETDPSEAFVSPYMAELQLSRGDRLVAGTDGLENVRLEDWYASKLPRASTPQKFLTDLWSELKRSSELKEWTGENASGVAFFCDK
ncbi:MAG: hypothetical protein AAB383_00425 [Patescibacteria group bacterium]